VITKKWSWICDFIPTFSCHIIFLWEKLEEKFSISCWCHKYSISFYSVLEAARLVTYWNTLEFILEAVLSIECKFSCSRKQCYALLGFESTLPVILRKQSDVLTSRPHHHVIALIISLVNIKLRADKFLLYM
jgi:hypothetical protein